MGGTLQLVGHWLLPHAAIMSSVLAFAVVIAISYGFELFSLVSGLGRYDVYDAIASVIGGVSGMAMIFWAQYKFGW